MLAGDSTLIPIIEANAESSSPLNLIAKDTLDIHPYDRSNDLFLQGKIDKLVQKVSKLKLSNKQKDNIIEENRLSLRNKDEIIQNKDRIIEESRIDLRNKDVTVDRLTNTNNVLVQRNNHTYYVR